MQSISFFFEKYKKLGFVNDLYKKTLQEVLLKVAKIEIDKKQIQIQDEKILLKITGPAKSQVLILKNKIQKEFEDRLEKEGLKTNKKII